MSDWFRKFARATAVWTGSPWAFILACVVIIVWGLTGRIFHYSDTWQLIINTGTTIVTFLMVFLIQSTQNRDAREVHIKIDEIIRATKEARNQMINLENMTDQELEQLHQDLCLSNERTEQRLQQIQQHRKKRSGRNHR